MSETVRFCGDLSILFGIIIIVGYLYLKSVAQEISSFYDLEEFFDALKVYVKLLTLMLVAEFFVVGYGLRKAGEER
jgi:hypothetical protein